MSCSLHYRQIVGMLTAVSLLVAQKSIAADGLAAKPEPVPTINTVDVILGGGGVMQGYVVDAQGVPQADVEITLTTDNREQVTSRSDEKGRFGYRGIEGGSYQLTTEHGVVLCRAWTATTAPPRSAATMLLVHDQDLVRGQWAAPAGVNGAVSRMKRVMTNPFAVAAIVGAAVAIPVAVHNANQDDSGS